MMPPSRKNEVMTGSKLLEVSATAEAGTIEVTSITSWKANGGWVVTALEFGIHPSAHMSVKTQNVGIAFWGNLNDVAKTAETGSPYVTDRDAGLQRGSFVELEVMPVNYGPAVQV